MCNIAANIDTGEKRKNIYLELADTRKLGQISCQIGRYVLQYSSSFATRSY